MFLPLSLFLATTQGSFEPLALNPARPPVLWINPTGEVPGGRFGAGTYLTDTPYGIGMDFTGVHSGLFLPDAPQFHLTKSISISSWLYLTAYTNQNNFAPGAQVLFRGDDRSGNDPYHLTVLSDGTICFSIEDRASRGAFVNAPIDLHRWTHVLGTFDESTGRISLYIDGGLVRRITTDLKPAPDLDAGRNPGIGIGNVQAPFAGAHNQPLHGQIADLRLYDWVPTPAQAGYNGPISFGRMEGDVADLAKVKRYR